MLIVYPNKQNSFKHKKREYYLCYHEKEK